MAQRQRRDGKVVVGVMVGGAGEGGKMCVMCERARVKWREVVGG